ncbi:MAG: ABC transporter permease, partial [Caldilineaceae bacterium]|nr:ABC transporter permease [Caldilineaceae bacterium]
VYHIPLVVVDQSQDRKSREFIQALVVSQYFDVKLQAGSEAEVIAAIDRGQVRAGLLIPPNFATDTDRGTTTALMLLDGSDSASVSSGYSAASLIGQNYGLQLTVEQLQRRGMRTAMSGGGPSLPITTSARVLYNPDMIDIWFLLPGLAGLILQTLAVQQAALIIVRERELGTIEPILATPTRPLELVLSKMLPLLILCLLALGVIVLIGIFWFGVPFQGSLPLYFGLSLLFIMSSLGLGLLMSNRANTQREAQQMALMTMMFSLILGGMIYPRTAMPAIPRYMGSLLPMTYFVRLSRGVFTKGVGMEFVWSDAVALTVYTVIVILVAARNFKKRLD